MEIDEQKKTALLALLAIIAPNGEWVGGDVFRTIFPREGWQTILAYVAELVADGTLERNIIAGNGGALYEQYRLVGGE